MLGLAASVFLVLVGAPCAVAAALPLTHLFVLAAGSLVVGVRRRDAAGVLLPLALATMHLIWVTGFFLSTGLSGGFRTHPIVKTGATLARKHLPVTLFWGNASVSFRFGISWVTCLISFRHVHSISTFCTRKGGWQLTWIEREKSQIRPRSKSG